MNGQRWDDALLAAGFDVDPDERLEGRAAAELAGGASGHDEHGAQAASNDPWGDESVPVSGLTAAQRAYVEATSPALGGALPPQSLTGDDPLGQVDPTDVQAADDDVIDFD